MIKEMKNGVFTYNDESYNFDFYTDLSATNKLKFVNSVVSILVDDTNYNSIIRDLVFDFYIVDIFSDFDTTDLKESNFFVNDVEQFLEETNIVDIIKANMEDGLLEELNEAINNSIAYRTGINTNHVNEALASLLSTIERKLNEIDLDSAMDMVQKFSGMTGKFTPESIVNAYINSDAHKNNLEEIAEVKKSSKGK